MTQFEEDEYDRQIDEIHNEVRELQMKMEADPDDEELKRIRSQIKKLKRKQQDLLGILEVEQYLLENNNFVEVVV